MSVIFKPDFLYCENQDNLTTLNASFEREQDNLNEEICSGNIKHKICTLEPNDAICGNVFFNKISRILKFDCRFCQIIFDNIFEYCSHLSLHIPDDNEAEIKSEDDNEEAEQSEQLFNGWQDEAATTHKEINSRMDDDENYEEDEEAEEEEEYGDGFVSPVDDEEMLKMYVTKQPTASSAMEYESDEEMFKMYETKQPTASSAMEYESDEEEDQQENNSELPAQQVPSNFKAVPVKTTSPTTTIVPEDLYQAAGQEEDQQENNSELPAQQVPSNFKAVPVKTTSPTTTIVPEDLYQAAGQEEDQQENNSELLAQLVPSNFKAVPVKTTSPTTTIVPEDLYQAAGIESIPNLPEGIDHTELNPALSAEISTNTNTKNERLVFKEFQLISNVNAAAKVGKKSSYTIKTPVISKATDSAVQKRSNLSTVESANENQQQKTSCAFQNGSDLSTNEEQQLQTSSTPLNKNSFVSGFEEFLKKQEARKAENKKVTTVKVITLKNRIAEIYDAIQKLHERERLEMEASERQNNDINETENRDPTQPNETGFAQNLYGDTVITHIPKFSAPDEIATSAAAELKKNICPACGKMFRNSFSLTVHKRVHYLEADSRVKLAHRCSDCPQFFNKLTEFKEHLASKHFPDGFVCRVCNKRLCNISQLETHLIKVHLEREFFCKACKCNFGTKREFECHNAKAHLPGDNFKCHICGRKYSKKGYLLMHMERHKQQKPQTCVVCGKESLRIMQHMKSHAPHPQRLHSCIICGKNFKFSSGLSAHFKKQHNRRLREFKAAMLLNNFSEKPTDQGKEQDQQELNEVQSTLSSTSSPSLEDTTIKEAEAKRVIVELVQNVNQKSFFPVSTDVSNENVFSEGATNLMDGVLVPPIAQEEVITAVNSIVDDV